MSKKKYPTFKNEEEEAEFWDAHSPLDYDPNPKSQKVKTIKTMSDKQPTKEQIKEVAGKEPRLYSDWAKSLELFDLWKAGKIVKLADNHNIIGGLIKSTDIKEALSLLELKKQGKLYTTYGGIPDAFNDPLYRVEPL